MVGLADWWWLVALALTWSTLFLASGRQSFHTFYKGGLWSVAIAAAIEFSIRRHVGFWRTDQAILAQLRLVGLATFVGPRFVEGTLFFQYFPKQTSLQLPAVILWASSSLLSDVIAAWLGFAHLDIQGAWISLLSHTLRFTALMSLFYGFSYERRAEQLGTIYRQGRWRRILQAAWSVSWIPFYWGIRALVARIDRRQG